MQRNLWSVSEMNGFSTFEHFKPVPNFTYKRKIIQDGIWTGYSIADFKLLLFTATVMNLLLRLIRVWYNIECTKERVTFFNQMDHQLLSTISLH